MNIPYSEIKVQKNNNKIVKCIVFYKKYDIL